MNRITQVVTTGTVTFQLHLTIDVPDNTGMSVVEFVNWLEIKTKEAILTESATRLQFDNLQHKFITT